MTTELHDGLLKLLKGTSSQHPLHIIQLREMAASLCDDPNELHAALDALYAERLVNRCAGMKEGNSYVAYWLTGAGNAPQLFSLVTSRQPGRIVPRTPIQPQATETPAKPIEQEQAMSTTTRPANVPGCILAKLEQHPGTTHFELVDHVVCTMPGTTVVQAKKAIQNMMHVTKRIRSEGSRGSRTLYLIGQQTHAAPAEQKQAAKKPVALPVYADKPKQNALACSFHLDGCLIIHKGNDRIALDQHEARQLIELTHRLHGYSSESAV